jgi:predicted dehydrogenase
MLDQVQLDAIYLAVPHHLHFRMIERALLAGIPIFTEKPVTRTLVEGKLISRLAAEKRVKVGVNYQYRYDSGCYRLARAVQSNELGQIHAVRINVPWRRELDYFKKSLWHSKIATAGGGTLITQASHFLDVVLWAMDGDKPKTAVGYTVQRCFQDVGAKDKNLAAIDVEDLAQGIIEMESGALIQVSSSMVTSSEQAASIDVYGAKGTGSYTPEPLPRVMFRDVRVKTRRPPHFGLHALQRCLEGFRVWIMENRPFLIPVDEALPVLAVVEAIYKSARTGRREIVERKLQKGIVDK